MTKRKAPAKAAAAPSRARTQTPSARAKARAELSQYLANLIAVWTRPVGLGKELSLDEIVMPRDLSRGSLTEELAEVLSKTFSAVALLTADNNFVLPSTDGLFWVTQLLGFGPAAVATAASEIVRHEDLSAEGALNTLSRLTDAVSLELRRLVLLAQLRSTDWNLTHTAERLRLGGVPNVLREIERTGLRSEYERERASGKVHKRPRQPNVVKPAP